MRRIFFKAAAVNVVLLAPLSANIGPQGFGEFRQNIFVETGTFQGDGIYNALKAGFQRVLSIESDAVLAQKAKRRYSRNSKVSIVYGDSSVDLWDLIKDIEEPATFWLDAHTYPPREDGGKNCPILEELEQIQRHPIKTHTILIDDMHCCGTESFDFLERADFIKKLLEINLDYQILYVDGGDEGEYQDNVMVATVKKSS